MGGESNSISPLPLENFRLLKKYIYIKKIIPGGVGSAGASPPNPAPRAGWWLRGTGWFYPWVTTELGWGWSHSGPRAGGAAGAAGVPGAANWGAGVAQGDAAAPSQPRSPGTIRGDAQFGCRKRQRMLRCLSGDGAAARGARQGRIQALPGTRGGCKSASPWAPSPPGHREGPMPADDGQGHCFTQDQLFCPGRL